MKLFGGFFMERLTRRFRASVSKQPLTSRKLQPSIMTAIKYFMHEQHQTSISSLFISASRSAHDASASIKSFQQCRNMLTWLSDNFQPLFLLSLFFYALYLSPVCRGEGSPVLSQVAAATAFDQVT